MYTNKPFKPPGPSKKCDTAPITPVDLTSVHATVVALQLALADLELKVDAVIADMEELMQDRDDTEEYDEESA